MKTDERWNAVVTNDRRYDGKFFYGVKSTGIFCRPSCPSKLPKPEHVVFFESREEAEAAGFRPCKRCRPELASCDPAMEHPHRFCDTPLGLVHMVEDQQGLLSLKFVDYPAVPTRAGQKGLYLADAERQLLEYFAGKRRAFDIPLSIRGSQFQERVWGALRSIPYGETRSYQQIAQAVGDGKAARAVGMANNRNPILILIPCHRVVGKNGKLVGFAGGMERKQALLALEAAP